MYDNLIAGWFCLVIAIAVIGVYGLRISWEIIKTGVVVLFAIGVIMLVGCTAQDDSLYVQPEKQASTHLPTKCRPYYNDGTERWIDCMGVGYVREQDDEMD
jgi:hypothetical protein